VTLLRISETILSPSEFLFTWIIDGKRYLSQAAWEQFATYGNYRLGKYDARIYDQRLLDIKEYLIANKGLTVLDVGCGVGNEALYFAYCGASCLGIDVNKKRLWCAKERASVQQRLVGVPGDCCFQEIGILDLDQQFDVVWMQEAFHHLEPRDKIVRKLSVLVKKGGYLFISETNALNPLVQIQLLKKRGFATIIQLYDEHGNPMLYGNERVISPFALSKMLVSTGFEVKLVRFFRLVPKRIAYVLGERLIYVLESVLGLEKIPVFAVHYNLVARKS
jgi:2-polyprenyl-3-methyl-5-hydroxy-6-metoxy-1,4-benzoquinol methylase